MSDIRESIRRHLELSERLHKATKEVLYENKDVADVAQNYGFKLWELKRKTKILRKKNRYFELKDKYEGAVKDVFFGLTLTDAARKYIIRTVTLAKEYKKNKRLGRFYKFDRLSNHKDGAFTFMQEFLLLERLLLWKESSQCACQVCAMEHLLNLAYYFTQEENKQCPSIWHKYKRADTNWLYEFLLRYIEEISKFKSADLCAKEPRESMSASYVII